MFILMMDPFDYDGHLLRKASKLNFDMPGPRKLSIVLKVSVFFYCSHLESSLPQPVARTTHGLI